MKAGSHLAILVSICAQLSERQRAARMLAVRLAASEAEGAARGRLIESLASRVEELERDLASRVEELERIYGSRSWRWLVRFWAIKKWLLGERGSGTGG